MKKKHKKRHKKKRHDISLPDRQTQPTTLDSPDKKALKQDNPLKGIVAQHSTFSGPIPPPALLAEYDKIIPNGADRILIMAENQSAHRQYLEKWAIVGGTILSFFGVACACILSLATLLFGYKLIIAGKATTGTIFVGSGLLGLVATFIYGTRSRREERLQRDQQNRELTRQR